MPTFTEGKYVGDWLVYMLSSQYCTTEIVVKSGEGKLSTGSVLGALTADGKYVLSPNTGSDGSQTAVGILMFDVDATSADAKGVLLNDIAQVAPNQLTFDSTVDNATKRAAKMTQLRAVNIKTAKEA